ncbi:histidine kinase [Winogradskyella sp.]|uniref:sensor histidine kinase n=1 Tax=Winogradskyella sp. TaxID=1883156 RepID=UPI001B002C9C|nr:histidine kinase [Winogradskyella sp.]MBO6880938.1 hypothetical protein [Winogradskyella sp.]
MKQLKFILLAFLIVLVSTLNSQNFELLPGHTDYQLKRLPFNVKEDHGRFYSFKKDEEGYLWVSSSSGMYVYDGANYIKYTNGNDKFSFCKDSLSSNFTDIEKDSEGNLYTALWDYKQLLKFNPATRIGKVIFKPKNASETQLPSFKIDKTDRLFNVIAYNNRNTIELSEIYNDNTHQTLAEISLDTNTNEFFKYFEIVNGNFFILTSHWLYQLSYNGKELHKIKNPKGNLGFHYMTSSAKTLYLLTNDGSKIYTYDFDVKSVKEYLILPNVGESKIFPLAIYNNSIVYYNGFNLFLIDVKKGKHYRFEMSSELQDDMYEDVIDFELNADGSILILTDKSVYKIIELKTKESNSFEEQLALNETPSLRALSEDQEGNIYASYYNGLLRKQLGDSIFRTFDIPFPEQLKVESVFGLSYWNGHLLWNNVSIDLNDEKLTKFTQNPNIQHTTHLLEKDSLWFFEWESTSLMKRNLKNNTTESFALNKSDFQEYPLQMMNAIVADHSDNSLWIATRLNGVCKLTREGELIAHYANKDLNTEIDGGINDLYLNNDTLWMGSFNGLAYLNTKTKEVKTIPLPTVEGNGKLINRVVYSILPNENNQLYLGTNYGLLLFDLSSLDFLELPSEHPMANVEFNRASKFKDSDGKYYFGSTRGLYAFYEEELDWDELENVHGPIRINSITIFDSKGNSRHVNRRVNELNKLELKASDMSLNVDFSSLKIDRNIFYSYRLPEINTKWSDYSENQYVNITSLPPGITTLEIRGLNDNIQKTIVFDKAQIWYKKLWVQLLVMAVFVTLVTVSIRTRYKQKLRHEKKLSQLRHKISNDLHDDVGTILTAVAMQSEILGRNSKSDQKSKFEKISQLSREAMSRMRDTVWSIDSNKDNVDSLINRMKDFLADVFESHETMYYKFNAIGKTRLSNKLNPDIRQNIYLIFKEAVNNTIKHSNGDLLTVTIQADLKMIQLTVSDNGNTNMRKATSGLGLNSMQSRAETINGQLQIKNNSGFTVKLMAPLNSKTI